MGINLKNDEIKVMRETLNYLKGLYVYLDAPSPEHQKVLQNYESLLAEIDKKLVYDREYAREHMRQYRTANENRKQYAKDYYLKHREKLKEYNKNYYHTVTKQKRKQKQEEGRNDNEKD